MLALGHTAGEEGLMVEETGRGLPIHSEKGVTSCSQEAVFLLRSLKHYR